MPFIVWFLVSASVAWCTGARAELAWREHSPQILEAYGDSITAGFLSGTSLVNPPPLHGVDKDGVSVSRFITDLACYGGSNDRDCLKRDHWPDYAWPSVLGQMEQARFRHPVEVRNQAFVLALATDLLQQVTGAPPVDAPVGAFFYIGYNDLDDAEPEARSLIASYTQHYAEALGEWDARHTDSVAYLVPLMDIAEVYDVLDGYVWYRSKARSYTCQTSWNFLFPYGANHALQFRKGELHSFTEPREAGMNASLDKLAADAADQSKRGNRFEVLHGIYNGTIRPEYFAVDCYHLSQIGQRVIARSVELALEQSASERKSRRGEATDEVSPPSLH